MARITVDDCIKYFPNRFELTLAATNRARQLALGASPLVEANRDKPTRRSRCARSPAARWARSSSIPRRPTPPVL